MSIAILLDPKVRGAVTAKGTTKVPRSQNLLEQ